MGNKERIFNWVKEEIIGLDPKWRILPHQSAVLQKEHCIATRTRGTWIGGQEKEEGDTGHSSVCMSLPS